MKAKVGSVIATRTHRFKIVEDRIRQDPYYLRYALLDLDENAIVDIAAEIQPLIDSLEEAYGEITIYDV